MTNSREECATTVPLPSSTPSCTKGDSHLVSKQWITAQPSSVDVCVCAAVCSSTTVNSSRRLRGEADSGLNTQDTLSPCDDSGLYPKLHYNDVKSATSAVRFHCGALVIRQNGIETSFFRIITDRKTAVAEDILPRTGRQTELKACWQTLRERVTEF